MEEELSQIELDSKARMIGGGGLSIVAKVLMVGDTNPTIIIWLCAMSAEVRRVKVFEMKYLGSSLGMSYMDRCRNRDNTFDEEYGPEYSKLVWTHGGGG